MGDKIPTNADVVIVDGGAKQIEEGTLLTRLHYFDGKFLRADALTIEQNYHRSLVKLSNLAGGWGVVHGFGIDRQGGMLGVSPGLSITPAGSTVLLTSAIRVEIAQLIGAAAPAPTPAPIPGVASSGRFEECIERAPVANVETPGTDYYEITVGPAQALCGNEEVFGKLCEDACVTDTQRPLLREGTIVRLRPIRLALPGSASVPLDTVHLQNQVASAYFASEPWLWRSLLSEKGLHNGIWCNPAMLYTRDEVPIGILVRSGATTRFIDAWSARRERMDTQAKGYWQGRMMMRPWNVFVAQILQFQCQLSGLFKPDSPQFTPVDDDCVRLRAVLDQSVRQLTVLRARYADSHDEILNMVGAVSNEYQKTVSAIGESTQGLEELTDTLIAFQGSLPAYTPNRLLLNGGFVELPSAGYLPVVPGKQPINTQMQRMFGEGVNLHFCTARADYIPHAVEQAQHMERISLTRGLDDPARKEEVEIFVPDGEIVGATEARDGNTWFIDLAPEVVDLFTNSINARGVDQLVELKLRKAASNARVAEDKVGPIAAAPLTLTGIARTTRLEEGGATLTLVCQVADGNSIRQQDLQIRNMVSDEVLEGLLPRVHALCIDLRISADPFSQREGDQVPISVELRKLETVVVPGPNNTSTTVPQSVVSTGTGTLTIGSAYEVDTGIAGVTATASMRVKVRAYHPDGTPVSPPPRDLDVEEVPFRLERKGNAGDGSLSILPTPMVKAIRLLEAAIAWVATWGGAPRTAAFGRPSRIAVPFPTNFGIPFPDAPAKGGVGVAAPAIPELERINFPTASDSPIVPLVRMRQAEGLLAPESPVRITALNTLSLIADATVDQPFLARARRLLFPETAQPEAGINVRATRDWVMFRRQRKAICEAAARPAPPEKLQSFQTWHIQFANADALLKLMQTLDDPEAGVLRNAKRVNVLHFAEGSATPTDRVAEIIQRWQAAKALGQVAVGLVWERATATVQNSLDVRRLKGLTELLQVQGLIATPADAPIARVPNAPSGLDDPAFDGGMLLVTLAKPVEHDLVHRVFFIREAAFSDVEGIIKTRPGDLPELLPQMQFPNREANFSVHFRESTASDSDLENLHQFALASFGLDRLVAAALLVATPSTETAEITLAVAKDEYLSIRNAIPLRDLSPQTRQLPAVKDFGMGAIAATVVFFAERIEPVEPVEQILVHRVYFMPQSVRLKLERTIAATPDAQVRRLLEEVELSVSMQLSGNAVRPPFFVQFRGGEPVPDELGKVVEFARTKSLIPDDDPTKDPLCLVARLLADVVVAKKDHRRICESVLPIRLDFKTAQIEIDDFEKGALAATVLFFNDHVGIRRTEGPKPSAKKTPAKKTRAKKTPAKKTPVKRPAKAHG